MTNMIEKQEVQYIFYWITFFPLLHEVEDYYCNFSYQITGLIKKEKGKTEKLSHSVKKNPSKFFKEKERKKKKNEGEKQIVLYLDAYQSRERVGCGVWV